MSKKKKKKELKPNVAQMLKYMSHSLHSQTCWDLIPSGQRSRSQTSGRKTQERFREDVYVKLSNHSKGKQLLEEDLRPGCWEFTGEVLQQASACLVIIWGRSWVHRTTCKQAITVCKSQVGVICDMLFRHRFQQTTVPVSLKKALKSTCKLIYAAFTQLL